MNIDESVFIRGELIIDAEYPDVVADIIMSYLELDLKFVEVMDDLNDIADTYNHVYGTEATPINMIHTINSLLK